jgi:hypothetical protein
MESRFSGKFSNSRSSRYIETGLFASSRSSRSVNKTGSSGGKLGEGGDCEGSRPRVLIERTREERTAFDTGGQGEGEGGEGERAGGKRVGSS